MYWLQEGFSIDSFNDEAVDIDVTQLYEGYKEDIQKLIPNLKLINFMDVEARVEHQTLTYNRFDEIQYNNLVHLTDQSY